MALTARPAHLDLRRIGLVLAGGVVGTALRNWIETLSAPEPGMFPWATFAINVTGALLLGLLVEALARRVRDTRRRQALQLTFGTGLLGGYTTYSTFALETVALGDDELGLALGYAVASMVGGFLAAQLGMTLGRRGGASR